MRLASLSKAITGAAIQTLVASGKLSLDDKMIDLIPDLCSDELEGCEFPNHSNQLDADPDGVLNTIDDFIGASKILQSHIWST